MTNSNVNFAVDPIETNFSVNFAENTIDSSLVMSYSVRDLDGCTLEQVHTSVKNRILWVWVWVWGWGCGMDSGGGRCYYSIGIGGIVMSEPDASRTRVENALGESSKTILSLIPASADIAAMSGLVIGVLKAGGKVLTAGNGGSAAEALHMSEELVGRFRGNRRSLPAVSLVADSTALTCIGNDFGYDEVFSRQVEGLGVGGDLLVLFSTSGSATNLARAVEQARANGMKVACLLGRDGGLLAGKADCEVIVEGSATERIQEAHQVILHIILDAVEREFE